MNKKTFQKAAIFFITGVGFLAAHFVLAQNLGINEVGAGLGGALSAADPRTIIGRIINIALGFLGVIAVGLIIYAGFLWMSSNGEEEKVETAKKLLKNAVIGLIIILSSWAIAVFIISRLGGTGDGTGGPCLEGESMSCGCGGAMVCSGGSFGSCVGSDCSGGGLGNKPASCDSGINPGCQAANQICAPTDYCDGNDCGCKPKGNLGDSCDGDLANATCEADNNRCSEYLTCNPSSCVCYGPPVITAVSPVGGFCNSNPNQTCTADSDCATTCNLKAPNGAAGNFITIIGKNFGAYSATASRVIFDGNGDPRDGRRPAELNSVCVDTWSDKEIVIAIPAGVSTGAIKVVNIDNLSDATNDTVGPTIPDFQANNIIRPGLCYLSPNSGALSSQVGYQGVNLYSGSAYFGSYQSNVKALSSVFNNPGGLMGTSTTPNIRSGESGSFVQNNINGHQEKSNYLSFTKEPEPGEGPFIASFDPIEGNAGQYVTIRGSGFGGARGASQVFFGNVEAAYNFPDMCLNSVWNDNQIIVKVPADLADGYQIIKVVLGAKTLDTQKLNPNTFRSDKNLDLTASLCKIDPEFGPIATPVTLWGEYFGQLNGEGLINFNYKKAATGTITILKDSQTDTIKTDVPAGSITGPVRIVKKSREGNGLNFSIGECAADSDCGTQVCCPQSTYKKGRCVDTLADCFINIPTSVFEWSFSTGFGDSDINPYAYSCAGLAKYFGSCQTGSSCPNVPGACSSNAGGIKTIGDCDHTCAKVAGCGELGANNCTYNPAIDQCVKNGANSTCSLDSIMTYTLSGKNYSATQTCNKDKHWEMGTPASCPTGWTRASGDRCVDLDSSCSVCSPDFTCEDIAGTGAVGSCVSKNICPGGSTCGDTDKCLEPVQAGCDCCCTIGQDARDCCAPLKCAGTCGSDSSLTDGPNGANAGLGKCGGCASVGTTAAEHDAACNCSGHEGQYCDTNNPSFPDGVCSDCSSLNITNVLSDPSGIKRAEHSGACCIDAKGTASTTDDFYRGGSGLLVSPILGSQAYGYCAYYDCSKINPTQCASTTALQIGAYASPGDCGGKCAEENSCAGLDQTACSNNPKCCFDFKTATSSEACILGDPIDGGNDKGYCAYYDCQTPPADKLCASTTPKRTGNFKNIDLCVKECLTPPIGPDLSCAGAATSTCATDKCTFAGFGCFSPKGLLGTEATDCGTCCCQPGANDACKSVNPKLQCLANKGSCSGTSRGLCCGCSGDSECGSPATVGCGTDTCCKARPEIVATSPAHMQTDVCRNAVIKVDFNTKMDIGSLTDNVLLLEERSYDKGVCPAGTFVAEADSVEKLLAYKNQGRLARLIGKIGNKWTRAVKRFSGEALADMPSQSNLYCALAGTVSGENNGESGSLLFAPKKLLAASSNYYLIVFGDTNLNSQSGVLSLGGVGFNGPGYFNADTNVYVEGEAVRFNNKNYVNSQIIKFSTLSEQGPMAGICALDSVAVSPSSYLIQTTDNNLNEDDTNVNDKTFDSAADKDKVFTAQAYSLDKQMIQPTTGYFWNWNFQVDDSSMASIASVSGLAKNKVFVSAVNGVTDAETKVRATVNMDNFVSGSCKSANCSCADDVCSNNCCNAYSGGNNFNQSADLYVFSCRNPWPPVINGAAWSPWTDQKNNCVDSAGGNCLNYNYKFYYCRDAGAADTLDDLPAIINQAVIRGQSSNPANFVCSADRQPCSVKETVCGSDQNGDESPDGICIWNILKESYFFREAIVTGGSITAATDLQTGGTVKVSWQSVADQVGSYKIYYLQSGKGAILEKAIDLDACTQAGSIYNCNSIVTGLTDGVPYVFKVSLVSADKTEGLLAGEISAAPSAKVPPQVPIGLQAEIKNDRLLFTWTANTDKAVSYILYHGAYSRSYGEAFPSTVKATSTSFDLDRFGLGGNFFALSAVDAAGNESGKSIEMSFVKTSCATPEKPDCATFSFFQNVLTNIDFEKSTAGGLPQDWSSSNQQRSYVSSNQLVFLSGKQSVLLHQDPGYSYPGTCSQKQCADTGSCVWNSTNKTCGFSAPDDCHRNGPAVYNEGEDLCWGQSNRVMWLRLAYSLANLDFKVGDRYAINFYYKGKTAGDVNVGLAASLGWSSLCVPYSYVGALKPGYFWQNGTVVPPPLPGVDPCSGAYGPSCSQQANYCCAMSPAQKKCYNGKYLPTILANSYDQWNWYYYPFDYTSEMASWVNSSGGKMIEVGLSIGYNSTYNGTDLYIDDFTVTKIATSTIVNG